jgi:hypothetical protein
VGIVGLVGLLVGALLWVLTDVLGKSDIGGPGWSLRGNGALVVPFAGGPAALTAGWSMLTLWQRAHGKWLVAGLVGGCLTLMVELIAGFAPVLAGPGGRGSGAGLDWLLLGVVPVLALAAGYGLAARFARLGRREVIAGALCWLLAAGAGLSLPAMFIVIPLLVPLIVAAPLLVAPAAPGGRTRSGVWLEAACAVLPIALVGGFFLPMRLLPAG